jgi:hypothetical protein
VEAGLDDAIPVPDVVQPCTVGNRRAPRVVEQARNPASLPRDSSRVGEVRIQVPEELARDARGIGFVDVRERDLGTDQRR